jgi:hypothetical protein
MKQELSFEQKCRFYDKVKDQNFRDSSRLEGIDLDSDELPASPQERAELKAALIARYVQKATAIEGA